MTAHYEYLIIGAGPSGLQMGYFLEKSGRSYMILEAGDSAGTFFKKFPRHRKLISNNKVSTGFNNTELNLRWDWNSLLSDSDEMLFKHYSKRYFPPADDMVRYLNDYAAHFNLHVTYGAKVTNVSKGDTFVVLDSQGNTYSCDRLIIATGWTVPRIPQISGIEFAEDYSDVSVEPEDFRDQRVMIIGKGNSGFETADNLVETTAAIHLASPTPVRLAWKTHFVGHLRAVNNNVLDTYQLKSQNTIIDANIERIQRQDGKLIVTICYTHAEGQRIHIPVDRVITCTGFRFNDAIFDDTCKPKLAIGDKMAALTSEWESENVKDMYFIGTLMQMRDYHKTFSGFIHGFRYNVRALSQIFAVKYHGKTWPSRPVDPSSETVMDAIMQRIHANSSLFQQPGFFCDMVALPEEGSEARYYQDVPIDYLNSSGLGGYKHYYTVTMEYGHDDHADPFNIQRFPDQGTRSHFIHPVIRHFSGPTLVSEYHVAEDLENNWLQDMYLRPFHEFLRQELAGQVGKAE